MGSFLFEEMGGGDLEHLLLRRLRRRSADTHLLGLRVRIQPGHGCLSVVSVVCCQVEVSATS